MSEKDKTEELDEKKDDEEESDDEGTDEEEAEEEEEESDEEESDSEDDDSEEDPESPDLDNNDEDEDDEDIDDQMQRERKGKPDPDRAQDAYRKREDKRKGEDDEDKPLTKRQLEEILARDRKERREQDARAIASTLSKKPKVVELLVEKWKNRTFPENLTLQQQMVEIYGGTYANKLIGEKNEALRALRNKGRVNRDSSSTHRDGQPSKGQPKLPPADLRAIQGMGYKWVSNRWEKQLANGGKLIRDPKTKRTTYIRPASK